MRSFLRLDSLSPSLGRSFRKANDDQRRRATLEACIFAISQTGLESEHIDSAIDYLRHGGSYPLAVRRKLEALTTQLDEEYFKLSEALPEGKSGGSIGVLTVSVRGTVTRGDLRSHQCMQ
jgi:hypothetical protein